MINGPAEVGKDTFIGICGKFLGKQNVKNYSSIEPAKKAAPTLGCQYDQGEKTRDFLKRLKDLSDEFWECSTNHLRNSIEKKCQGKVLVFLHIREPYNIDKIKAYYPEILTCHINRIGSTMFNNPADTSTWGYEYDFYIDNSGTLGDLHVLAWEFIQKLYPDKFQTAEMPTVS